MKKNQLEKLEAYFQTENEYWNKYAFEFLCLVIKENKFETPETPMLLFSKAIDVFLGNHNKPLQAVNLFEEEVNSHDLTLEQKEIIYKQVFEYLDRTNFEEVCLDEIALVLKSKLTTIRKEASKEPEYNKPTTGDLRETLKEFIQNELKDLPTTLGKLDSVQRLNILCKLMPFALPKTDSVRHNLGEPETFKKY